MLSPTGLIPWFSKTEGNTYANLLHHPFLFKGKPTQCSRGSTHLFYKGFMPHYNVWTKHGEIGVMMEDSEEEEDDDNYMPFEYGDAAMGEA